MTTKAKHVRAELSASTTTSRKTNWFKTFCPPLTELLKSLRPARALSTLVVERAKRSSSWQRHSLRLSSLAMTRPNMR